MKFPNEELYNLYSSPDVIRMIESKLYEMDDARRMHGG
jgi:hypothetical protein